MPSVVVEPYNPTWPLSFETIKTRLDAVLASTPYTSIQHVGSTSVPHLAAKPIIDIDIIVPTPAAVAPVVAALVSRAGFTDLGELGIAGRYCVKDSEQTPPRNIYVCVEGAAALRNHLGLRDVLRRDDALRDEYARVKLALAGAGMDVIDYVAAKGVVVQKILKASGLLSDAELAAIDAANTAEGIFGAVRTDRLVLREFQFADGEAFFELEGDERVARYQTWPPRTREQARDEVARTMRAVNEVPRTHVELAVELEGKFVGRVGANVKRDAEPPHADLWFSFMPKVHGKGYATEAVSAFIPLLGSPLELEIECDPRNTGSWKMAERLGFEKVSLTEKAFECKGEWVGSLVYRKTV